MKTAKLTSGLVINDFFEKIGFGFLSWWHHRSEVTANFGKYDDIFFKDATGSSNFSIVLFFYSEFQVTQVKVIMLQKHFVPSFKLNMSQKNIKIFWNDFNKP